jgi:FMN phosphatase YigB (HAD superfamily)
MKKSLLALTLCLNLALFGEVRDIERLDAILPEIDKKTLVLFDLDETLIEVPIMLGGKAWRRYARALLERTYSEEKATELHDKLTYLLAKKVPFIAIEENAADSLEKIEEKGGLAFGFTARGRHHWYDMPAADGEELGLLHTRQAGFSFKQSFDDPLFSHRSYSCGIFFAYPLEDKGELLLELFALTDFRPAKLVFIDDKISNVRAVDSAAEQLGIPALCFHYRQIDLYRHFDPLVAHIQLERFLQDGSVLSDSQAAAGRGKYAGRDVDAFFLELISQIETHLSR